MFYADSVFIFSLKRALESGTEKGYWDLVGGNAGSGYYRLDIDSFDPTDGTFNQIICL